MSVAKRILIAVAASAVTVGVVFSLLTIFPIPVVGGAFVAVGFPLGILIFEATPERFVRELAAQGGPDAVSWAIALGTLITWFALCFGLWFLALRRKRSNSTPHSDARSSALLDQPPPARAGERGR